MAKRSKKIRSTGAGKSPGVSGASALLTVFQGDWFWGVVLVVAVVLTYAQVWQAGFVWDDTFHVTENPCIVGPLGLKEIWTTSAGMPFPLVFTTFWVEHALWGLEPLPYHLVNVAMQAASGILLWRVLLAMKIPGAWLGAALWALHPVQVESVAWVSELKNTQSGLFYLGSILFFLKWLDNIERTDAGRNNYILALGFAALAMASKSSTVVLPVVLGLCAWWVKGRIDRPLLLRLAPFFVLSLVAAAVTLWPRAVNPDTQSDVQWIQTWPQRIAISGGAIWFYLGKLIWPYPLMAVYPRWEIDAAKALSYMPVALAILLLVVLGLYRESKLRPFFFAYVYFLVVIAPFLGLIHQSFWRFSFVEDHLPYLASMGPLALAGAGLAWLGQSSSSRPYRLAALGGTVLVALAIVSWQRAGVFADEETLWRDNLAKNPNCWVAENNLGNALRDKGELDEAIGHFQAALRLFPSYAVAHNDLGLALANRGQLDEAVAQYRAALEIIPSYAVAHDNLGVALMQKGRVDDAITEFQKALAIKPEFEEAHGNLGGALCQKGRFDEGIVQLQEFLKGNPDSPLAHANLGNAYLRKGELNEALTEIEEALRLKPDFALATQLLAQARAMEQQDPGSK